MTDRETLRLPPPVIFWWVWVAFVAVNVIDYAVQGLPSARFGAVVGAVLLLVTGLAFTLALRPKVIASDDGITVVNPYRTHVVPWRLVTLVDTGEWVQVHYAPAAAGRRGRRRPRLRGRPRRGSEQRGRQDRALLGAVRLRAGQAADRERPAAPSQPAGAARPWPRRRRLRPQCPLGGRRGGRSRAGLRVLPPPRGGQVPGLPPARQGHGGPPGHQGRPRARPRGERHRRERRRAAAGDGERGPGPPWPPWWSPP